MKKQIKIIKCSVSTYWYNNHINEIFDCTEGIDSYEVFFSKLPHKLFNNDWDSFGGLVNKEDAIELNRFHKINKILKNIK